MGKIPIAMIRLKHVWTRHMIQMDLEPDAINRHHVVICLGNESIFNHGFARLGHDL